MVRGHKCELDHFAAADSGWTELQHVWSPLLDH
jgi:hypothetical protein